MAKTADKSCKTCIFAEYDGITQHGCAAGMIDKFENMEDVKVIPAYDEEKEFYVIEGRFCHMKRPEEWVENIDGKDKTKEELLEHAKKEIELPYQAIIFTTNKEKELAKTLDSLFSQKTPPKHITVVRNIDQKVHPREMSLILDSYNVPWKIENILRQDMTKDKQIDIIMHSVMYPYYMVIDSGRQVPKNFVAKLHNLIIERMGSFGYLSVDNIQFIPGMVHKVLNGNVGSTLKTKVEKEKWPIITKL